MNINLGLSGENGNGDNMMGMEILIMEMGWRLGSSDIGMGWGQNNLLCHRVIHTHSHK